ncbi:hypothetical protein ASPZODRAFT_127254 [Penicilliopsis zonata CBS 506.65]|uniref:Secreted protein n=1 Tax=Penicilliopsis zonata CBS 506.65 TaxID=1073090 RepID=A0A1L9SVQ7_9EURO|nr:hypothetical protein ASPZODRAFT_127254 [Penicilliopsis zonata CBS 506.65]OJJ51224.1 hypothetical protein ASPZODRAFT_127254 [Penicilliopsis zonata CBS 506.65]
MSVSVLSLSHLVSLSFLCPLHAEMFMIRPDRCPGYASFPGPLPALGIIHCHISPLKNCPSFSRVGKFEKFGECGS